MPARLVLSRRGMTELGALNQQGEPAACSDRDLMVAMSHDALRAVIADGAGARFVESCARR